MEPPVASRGPSLPRPGGSPVSPLSRAEAAAYARVDRRILPFLFLCYVLAYLDRVNVGFAKLQMVEDLSLSDAAFAAGAGIFFVGYFLFEVPSNLLLRRFGARTWIARIMISWGAISACTSFIRDERAFYLMRFLLGVAEAGFFPGIIYYLTLWYPSRLRASRTALFVSAVAVAGVIGNPVSGAIMEALSGARGLAGWQWLFLIEGVPSILVGACVLFCLDSGIQEARWLTPAEKALLAGNVEREERRKAEVHLTDAFRSGRAWALCAIYFTLTIGLYGISFWLPTIVKAFGVRGYLGVGFVTAVPYLVAVLGMQLLSRSSDRTGERRLHLAFSLAAGALGLVLSGAFASSPWIAMAFLSLGMLGVIGAIPVFWPIPSAFLGGTAAAAGIGLINSLGNLGGYVGPNLPVWASRFSADPSAPTYVIAAVLGAGAAVTWLAIPSDRRARAAARVRSR